MQITGRLGGLLAGALTVAAVAVPAQGRVLVHRCVESGGSWDDVAIRLALLRDAASCPDGSLGLGTAPTGAVVLLSVALPVLALHVLAAAFGVGLGALVVRAARLVARLVVRGRPGPPAPARPVARQRACVVHVAEVCSVMGLLVARPHRAPPLPA